MKITISEFDHIFWMQLEPENTAEAAQLMRLGNTPKREPINFITHFNGNIFCEFGINKKNRLHYSNIVTNRAKNSE